MPKTDIDYSNTIIYKITCKDTAIKDVYVGHTTNFVQRKHAHKQSCLNSKTVNYKCKLYEVIRANGGWDNWHMEIINLYDCKDHYEARKKEQEYFISLNATLNSIEPFPKPKVTEPTNNIVVEVREKKVFFCNICNILCNSSKTLEHHKLTNKHTKNVTVHDDATEVTNKSPNFNEFKFTCEYCHYNCGKNSEYIKHLLTAKHIGNASGNKKISDTYTCKLCDKVYKSRKGLWGHNKKCNEITTNNTIIEHTETVSPEGEIKNLTTMVIELMKSNADLQTQMMEVCKNSTSISNSHVNSHNNNKTFNLQFFLNEQCKDAMNMSEFVDSFDLQLSDLESVGELGYVEGMTKIFLDKLSSTDIYKRPMHCSDVKREILYIKDENKWEKEQRNNPKLRDAIKSLSFKNMKLTNLWSNTYPESKNNESRLNDVYMKLVIQSTGGSGANEDKIIRKIARDIFIDKNSIV